MAFARYKRGKGCKNSNECNAPFDKNTGAGFN